MIDRIRNPATAALLLVLTSGCTDGLSSQVEVPATAEPFDLRSLNGKIIQVEGLMSDSHKIRDQIHFVGTTIVWNGPWYESRCYLNGRPESGPFGDLMAIVFTPGQPRSNVKIACEGSKDLSGGSSIEIDPAVVAYSSTMALQGNVLELSGELREQNMTRSGAGHGLDAYTVAMDIREHLHAKFRLSADKCQVLEFSRSQEVVETSSIHDNRPSTSTWGERATGCSIVAAPR